ncbi:MAG: AraC family transcriptional regulator [Deltaproteobacteria bacterium]|nr:AraC family transcriptional regulator [Deltaproteobacteria bacterium]
MSFRENGLRREYQADLNRVLDYIDNHLQDNLSLEDLAGVACFSLFHFHRIFKSLVGETLSSYVKRLRLERAASVLTHYPHLSITEIALESGFSSSATFARAFKERFGVSASTWRQEALGHKSKIGKTKSKPGKDSPDRLEYGGFIGADSETIGFDQGGEMELKVEVKDMPALRVAYVRHMTGYNEGINQAYEKLAKWAGPRALLGPESRWVGMSLDDPDVTPAQKCRHDACLTVGQDTVVKEGEVGLKEIPGGPHAVARYEGNREGIIGFYNALYGQWLPQSGYQPADQLCYDLYLPESDPEQDHFVFDICFPVKPL